MNKTKKENISVIIFCAILFILSIIPLICIGISLYTLFLYSKIALFIMTYILFIIIMFLMQVFSSLYSYIEEEKKSEEKINYWSIFKKSLFDLPSIVLIITLFIVITIVLIIFAKFYY